MKKIRTILLFSFFTLPAMGQVMIESGPFGVGMSNRDGRSYGTATSVQPRTITTPAPLTGLAGFETNSTFRNVSPTVSTTVAPVRRTTSSDQQIVYRAQPVIEAKDRQMLQKMEQELFVIKTTRTAWMEFDADRIFNYGQSTIKASARPLLDKIVTYLTISRGKGIDVQYHFALGKDTSELGWARSSVLVSYFTEKTDHLSPGWFNSREPAGLVQHTNPGQRFPGEVRRQQHKSLVHIHVVR